MLLHRSFVSILANSCQVLRKNSTSCHKLVVTQYGDPSKSLSMTEETLPNPSKNEVCFLKFIYAFKMHTI